ncbi:MAG TPA: aminotransferase class V-fold PLP-dependent enzyme [Longimicrobiales bacterium]|nr:aminotransferase class V-fold PLP-dependent enzyme [Longimicrobiales bacterium]
MGNDTLSLELTPDAMRTMGYRVVDALVDRYAEACQAPTWQGGTRAELDALIREPAPEQPGDFYGALDRLLNDILPRGARVDHPRFMAFVPGAPTWPAVLGDVVAAGSNIFQGTWLASSGVSALELLVVDWFRQWLGCDDGAGGLLLSGGSVANLTAIACARTHRFGSHDDRAVIYCSSETHSSVLRGARILGFADNRVRVLPVDADHRLAPSALAGAVHDDVAAGLTPFLVVANAGTTSTGAVDPLPDLAAICRDRDIWLHVDAAYGGFAALTDRGRTLLQGIGRGDSITLDPHKWLYQPFEAGCLIVRDERLLEDAFRVLPPYLQDAAIQRSGGTGADTATIAHSPDAGTAGGGDLASAAPAVPVNFADRGIQLTRSARVLKIWLAIQTHGLAAYRRAIDRCMDLACRAAEHVDASTGLELLSPPRLGIVCFRREPPPGVDADEFNRRLLRRMMQSGTAMISSTIVDGRFALRLCVLNYRTTDDDVRQVLRWIENYDECLYR